MDEAGAFMTGGCESLEPPATTIRPDVGEMRSLPIFDGLSRCHVECLVASSRAVQYRAGTFIVGEGGRLDGLQVIHRGIVDLVHLDGEHECGVLLLSTKDLLLPAGAVFDEPSLVSVRALTTTRVIVFEARAVSAVLAESRIFMSNVMKAMSGQWRMAVRSILDLNCRSAAQRLAAFLLRLADLQQESGLAVLPIAKRHLAARLGMTAETLSRTLQVVAQNGLYLRGRSIIVHDRARIEAFCGPDPYPTRDDRSLNVFAL